LLLSVANFWQMISAKSTKKILAKKFGHTHYLFLGDGLQALLPEPSNSWHWADRPEAFSKLSL
jgi:hypothetical protein